MTLYNVIVEYQTSLPGTARARVRVYAYDMVHVQQLVKQRFGVDAEVRAVNPVEVGMLFQEERD